jgi:transcriptional regulator with XRE-family HTH domain
MEQLKRLREERGLSQVKLAARADLNPATVNQIERGARNASPGTLRKLADALGVSLVDLIEGNYPKARTPQPSLEDAARSEAFQEALAVLFRGLAHRGQGIIEQSVSEGPSEALSRKLNEYYAETAALHQIKGRRDIFGRDPDELAEAEAAYEEVESRIQAMLRQDVDATEEERNVALRFKDNSKSYEIEEPKADAS